MTRAMWDLQQLMNGGSGFTYTNVAGATIEDLAGKPTIEIESVLLRTQDTAHNVNGKIIFVSEEEANSIEFGQTRHEVYFINGYIQYKSTSKYDDATIMSIKAEMRRVLNVYNATSSTYHFTFSSSPGYNNDLVDGMIDFTIEAWKIGD